MIRNKNDTGISKELLMTVVRLLGGFVAFLLIGYFGYITTRVLEHDKSIEKLSEIGDLKGRLACNWKYTARNRNRIAQNHGVDPIPARCDAD